MAFALVPVTLKIFFVIVILIDRVDVFVNLLCLRNIYNTICLMTTVKVYVCYTLFCLKSTWGSPLDAARTPVHPSPLSKFKIYQQNWFYLTFGVLEHWQGRTKQTFVYCATWSPQTMVKDTSVSQLPEGVFKKLYTWIRVYYAVKYVFSDVLETPQHIVYITSILYNI